jgi:hypothetical protein
MKSLIFCLLSFTTLMQQAEMIDKKDIVVVAWAYGLPDLAILKYPKAFLQTGDTLYVRYLGGELAGIMTDISPYSLEGPFRILMSKPVFIDSTGYNSKEMHKKIISIYKQTLKKKK